jgi:NitT/TauT family transport system ATP-binding protein
MIEVIDVSKTFEKLGKAVHSVTLTVERGEFLVILGPSGCGKTTLLRMIAGLEIPDPSVEGEDPRNGKILIEGEEISGPGADRGMVFQSYTSFPWLKVKDNIAFGLRLKKMDKYEIDDRVQQYLRMVSLSNFADAYPSALSGGMKQRVAIARTLANEPKVLLMDEPFGALDAQTRNEMQKFLLDISAEQKITIIFVTHDIEEAVFLGDRVFVSTPRPCQLKEGHMIDIPFAKPRDSKIKTSPEFSKKVEELGDIIRSDVVRSIQRANSKPYVETKTPNAETETS